MRFGGYVSFMIKETKCFTRGPKSLRYPGHASEQLNLTSQLDVSSKLIWAGAGPDDLPRSPLTSKWLRPNEFCSLQTEIPFMQNQLKQASLHSSKARKTPSLWCNALFNFKMDDSYKYYIYTHAHTSTTIPPIKRKKGTSRWAKTHSLFMQAHSWKPGDCNAACKKSK